jgi:hypothetical protein
MRRKSNDCCRVCDRTNWACRLLVFAAVATPLPHGTLHAQMVSGAIVQPGQTTLNLPPGGSTYIYGMATGGARVSTGLAGGPYQQLRNAAGNLVAELAITQSNINSFETNTFSHTIGGVSVAGFKTISASYGSNDQPNASSASDTFAVSSPSVVVVFALAGGQTHLELQGVPGLQIDAQTVDDPSTTSMAIGHATLPPGSYTAMEVTGGATNPNFMGDLIGVFVFTAIEPAPPSPPSPPVTPKQTPASSVPNVIEVSGHAGPWDPMLNSAFEYGSHDQAPPTVVIAANGLPLLPGSVVTVAYVSGTVSVGGGWPDSDANGATSSAPASSRPRSGNYPSRYVDPSAYPIYVGSLIGTFAKDGVIVGGPFKIGDGPVSLTVPAGANQLLLGVNDNIFGDNSGSWTVGVSVHSSSSALSFVWVVVALILAAGLGAFFLLRRRKALIRGPIAGSPPGQEGAGMAPWTVPHMRLGGGALSEERAPSPARPSAPITMESLDRLAELKSLLDRGLVTREEFDREKAKVLES